MHDSAVFHTGTVLADALAELFRQLETRLSLSKPLTAFLAGGMAVHLYTATRVTTDVDAEFSSRVLIPNDIVVETRLEDGSRRLLYFDTNYNSSFVLMHEDYLDDAIPIDIGLEYIDVRVLSPVDLAVSKIARFAPNDRDDIRDLVHLGLTTAEEIEERANSALGGYIGDQIVLRHNIKDAVAIAHDATPKP